ncbi:PRTRC system protein E [Limibacterium fermenti]|jgi:PRTRC genetic system protein E|uniref:PRTRC system protein E n=1 Tax=Limibacterium fermenti TaxID=3229863 RepID=UPI003A69C235
MNANFFNQIAQMSITGALQITVLQGTDDNLIVSVLLQNEQCGDNAKHLIPPLTLKGTAEELDGGFFQSIVTPIEQTSSLLLNMESYLKAQEQARKQSAMEKEKADKEKKEREAKEKKFNEAMQKASALADEGKYREAFTAVPDVNRFPDYAEEIHKRKDELARHFAPNLFNANPIV